eukprot:g75100.t1
MAVSNQPYQNTAWLRNAVNHFNLLMTRYTYETKPRSRRPALLGLRATKGSRLWEPLFTVPTSMLLLYKVPTSGLEEP